jgi:hypothetical protein
MTPNRPLSSPGVRAATLLLAMFCAAAVALYRSAPSSQSSELLRGLAIGSGFVSVLGLIYSFAPLYRGWMRFASALQKAVTLLLFGACYLLVVPTFSLIVRFTDPLKRGKRFREVETLWVHAHRDERDPGSFQRMG